jgi:methyl coenzyme M reductase alpha subunit
MVRFGIKVNLNQIAMHCISLVEFACVGESNAGDTAYACKFAKMIQYWRQIWNERTNGITDIQFPFGFVQVSFFGRFFPPHHSE